MMSDSVYRVRMSAGPNGSGKTTIKNGLNKPDRWFGLYINPDDLEANARRQGFVDLDQFGLSATAADVCEHFASSSWLQDRGQMPTSIASASSANRIEFHGPTFNSYHASVLADFLRRRALSQAKSFSFETVMSSPDKVQLLRDAKASDYRTYLYFVATQNPKINMRRVANRVATGGHAVPFAKIIERYHRSLALLPEAIRAANRTYLFDSSTGNARFFAEVTDGSRIRYTSSEMPKWFAPHASQFTIVK